jgi:hypothetical protein
MRFLRVTSPSLETIVAVAARAMGGIARLDVVDSTRHFPPPRDARARCPSVSDGRG